MFIRILFIVIVFLLISVISAYSHGDKKLDSQISLEKTDCWFGKQENWPRADCFDMHVPENHRAENSRLIKFPVVIFRSDIKIAPKAPVLYLGAGGPGSAMYLDDSESVKVFLDYHDDFSLQLGRDLIVIDPRGVGLAEPKLVCDDYLINIKRRLRKNISLEQEMHAGEEDYDVCIARFKASGVDLSQYNSLAVSRDIELLRQYLKHEKWVLFGVSYAAHYAQVIASQFPDTVESMILDSPVFMNVELDNDYLEHSHKPYTFLFNYCDINIYCEKPIEGIEKRIWRLFETLQESPMTMSVWDSTVGSYMDIVVNGDRFIESLLVGQYATEIYEDLPLIVEELERGKSKYFQTYLQDYVAYLTDTEFSDISFTAHYCYEDHPFIDFGVLRDTIDQIPKGYIKRAGELFLSGADYCSTMGFAEGDRKVFHVEEIETPTLLMQGELDTVTPISDTVNEKQRFTNHQLLTFYVSHSVLSWEACAEKLAGIFVENHHITDGDQRCD